jgi:hypothetical protein
VHVTARPSPIPDDEVELVRAQQRRETTVYDFGLFAQTHAAPAKAPEPPAWHHFRLCTTPAEYANLAAFSRDGMALLEVARRVANAILDAQGSVAVWEVRLAMGQKGWLANNGKEALDAFGGLGTGMSLAAVDRERPPSWAQAVLEKSHANVSSVWVRPQHVADYNPATRRARAHSRPTKEKQQ